MPCRKSTNRAHQERNQQQRAAVLRPIPGLASRPIIVSARRTQSGRQKLQAHRVCAEPTAQQIAQARNVFPLDSRGARHLRVLARLGSIRNAIALLAAMGPRRATSL